MCNDLSSIICEPVGEAPPRIVRNDAVRSHETLVALYGLREGIGSRAGDAAFARLEYVPRLRDGDWDHCKLHIDELRRPSWLTEEMLKNAEREHAEHLKKITIDSDRGAVAGGVWRIKGKVRIRNATQCRFLVGKNDSLIIQGTAENVEFDEIHGKVAIADVHGALLNNWLHGTLSVHRVLTSSWLHTFRVLAGGLLSVGDAHGSVQVDDTDGNVEVVTVHTSGRSLSSRTGLTPSGCVNLGTVCGAARVHYNYGTVSASQVVGELVVACVDTGRGTVTVGMRDGKSSSVVINGKEMADGVMPLRFPPTAPPKTEVFS